MHRIVHKPSSFWTAKAECTALNGRLLQLSRTKEVIKALDESQVGNVESDYRIDGSLKGKWLEGENATIVGTHDFIAHPASLTLNLEDGSVLSTRSVVSQLGFICESDGANSKDCNSPQGSTTTRSVVDQSSVNDTVS